MSRHQAKRGSGRVSGAGPEESIRALVFPRNQFAPADAMAWGSLHGFDHATVRVVGDHLLMPQGGTSAKNPRGGLVVIDARDGIEAFTGPRGELTTDGPDYARHAAKLRSIALSGRSTIHRAALPHDGNDDLAAWYIAWFPTTHPGASRRELNIARAIVHGLRQASREHALTYVRKLGYRG